MPDGISNEIWWKTCTIDVLQMLACEKLNVFFKRQKYLKKPLATQISRSNTYRLPSLGPIEGQNVQKYTPHNRTTQRDQAVNANTLGKVFQNLEKSIQVCLDAKGDQFQHRLWAGPVLHRCQYVYINFQVIISITYFFRDNSLGPLARESPCMLTGVLANLNNSVLCGDARVVNNSWPRRTEGSRFDSRQCHESLSFLQNLQTGSGANPAFYSMSTGLLPWGEAERSQSCSLTSI